MFKLVLLSFAFVACFVSNTLAAVDYTLHKSANPNDDEREAYVLITQAMNEAVGYYNKYTNLSKHINVYYSSCVPTAEASSNGDLRFGRDRNYMYVGTAMHEMAHTMGMGTTNEYKAMIKDGVFQGQRAQALLREIDGPNAVLKGDSQHFWPYGLNYRSEIHSEQDLINHARIVDAMYHDIFGGSYASQGGNQGGYQGGNQGGYQGGYQGGNQGGYQGGNQAASQGKIKSLTNGKCMGITYSNTLELMDCYNPATNVKIYAEGGNPVAYRFELGSRVVDIPNESTAAGVKVSTWGYNGGAHQKFILEGSQNAILLRNQKSGHYLQAVGNDVIQNPLNNNNRNSFTWQITQ